MTTIRCIATLAAATCLMVLGCDKKNDSTPAPAPTQGTAPAPAPDNTAKNKIDLGDTKTPMDQSETTGNIKITADIRRAILDDHSMSVNAQNCKIVTDKSGMVTLRGVANSQAERDSVGAIAKSIAGVSSVDNQLEVKTK